MHFNAYLLLSQDAYQQFLLLCLRALWKFHHTHNMSWQIRQEHKLRILGMAPEMEQLSEGDWEVWESECGRPQKRVFSSTWQIDLQVSSQLWENQGALKSFTCSDYWKKQSTGRDKFIINEPV